MKKKIIVKIIVQKKNNISVLLKIVCCWKGGVLYGFTGRGSLQNPAMPVKKINKTWFYMVFIWIMTETGSHKGITPLILKIKYGAHNHMRRQIGTL